MYKNFTSGVLGVTHYHENSIVNIESGIGLQNGNSTFPKKMKVLALLVHITAINIFSLGRDERTNNHNLSHFNVEDIYISIRFILIKILCILCLNKEEISTGTGQHN